MLTKIFLIYLASVIFDAFAVALMLAAEWIALGVLVTVMIGFYIWRWYRSK
jgi:hypothetical protein